MMNSLIPISATMFLLFVSAFALRAQKIVEITQSTIIDASVEEVYALIKDFDRFPEWSPFLLTDPEQKNRTEGSSGELGSVFHWEGVAEKSLGYQTLSEVQADQYVKMDCTVQKPFRANSTFEYFIRPTDQGVEVRQVFRTEMGRFAYFMGNLFGMQKEIAASNALGLQRLKEVLEID